MNWGVAYEMFISIDMFWIDFIIFFHKISLDYFDLSLTSNQPKETMFAF